MLPSSAVLNIELYSQHTIVDVKMVNLPTGIIKTRASQERCFVTSLMF